MKFDVNKRYSKAIVGVLTGVALLTGAVFANFDHANGYSICKDAAKALLYQDNYSYTATLRFNLDETLLGESTEIYQINAKGDPFRYTQSKSTDLDSDGSYHTYSHSSSDDKEKHVTTTTNPAGYTSGSVSYYQYSPNSAPSPLLFDPSDETERKAITFVETIADTMVGNLKNSVVQTKNQDGERTYELTLSQSQLPDWASSGAALMTSIIREETESSLLYRETPNENNASDMLYYDLFGMGDPAIDTVFASMTVNEAGLPIRCSLRGSILGADQDGVPHTLTASIDMVFENYGTTVITPIDLSDITELTTYNDKDAVILQIPQDATEAMVDATYVRANELAEQGETVMIRTPEGEETVIYGSALEE